MNLPNATITAIRTVTGEKANGKPAFSAVTLIGPIPCRVQDPNQRHVRTAQADGVAVERVVTVEAAAFAAIGYTPKQKDRLTIARVAPGETIAAETRMVTMISRENPGAIELGDPYTLMFDTAEDNA